MRGKEGCGRPVVTFRRGCSGVERWVSFWVRVRVGGCLGCWRCFGVLVREEGGWGRWRRNVILAGWGGWCLGEAVVVRVGEDWCWIAAKTGEDLRG